MKRLEPDVEREVRRLAAKGHTLREIGRMLGCSRHAVTNTLGRAPRPTTASWTPSPARLSLREREEVRVGLERGDTLTAIASRIGRAMSTVSREVKANGGRDGYIGLTLYSELGLTPEQADEALTHGPAETSSSSLDRESP